MRKWIIYKQRIMVILASVLRCLPGNHGAILLDMNVPLDIVN